MEDNTYHWSGNDPKPSKKPKLPDMKRLAKNVLVILLFMAVITMAGTCFYTVDDKQQAVVTTFGKVTEVTDAGVHFKLPFGIQNVKKVDAIEILTKYKEVYSADDSKEEWFNKIKELCSACGYTPNVKEYKQNPDAFKGHVGDVSTVIRIAITSRTNTPDLYYIMKILGKDEVMRRIDNMIEG